MGRIKEYNRGKILEGQEGHHEISETGTELNDQARDIHGLLESIQVQDDDDQAAVQETEDRYEPAFHTAFGEQVEQTAGEITTESEELRTTIEGEMEQVGLGVRKMEQARDVSEIGRNAAETGAASLEKSRGEYEQQNQETDRLIQQVNETVRTLKLDLDSIW